MDAESDVREFLRDHVPTGQAGREISRNESLLDAGLLDSATILELVSFLEERFDLTISDEELLPENFETIDAIVGMVTAKRGPSSAAGHTSS